MDTQEMNEASMNAGELIEYLVAMFNHKESILIKGRPGIGKTSIAMQVAQAVNAEIIFAHPAVEDPTDYKGVGAIENGKAVFYPYDNLDQLVHMDHPCIYFIDDLGQAPTSIQKALMQILYDRKINGNTISQEVVFFAATNNRQDKAGVSGLIEPLKSRFTSIVSYEPTISDFERWWLSRDDMDIMPLAFVKFRPQLFSAFTPTNDIVNSPCPRTIAALGRQVKQCLPERLRYKAYTGTVGFGFAMEYLAFEQKAKSLVNLDRLLANPETTLIPEEPDVLYVTMQGIANKATRQNIGSVVTYVERVEQTGFAEFAMICMEQIRETKENVANTIPFTEWSTKHAELYE
jgi:hypothetical protein